MKSFETFFAAYKVEMKSLGISLHPPATIEDIAKLESAVKQKLPQEIKDFYSYCNGFETDDWLFNLLSIEQILYYKSELESSEFYFAEYMIYSDCWNIKLESSTNFSIITNIHGTEKQIVITDSIYEFLHIYLNSEGVFSAETGLYKWYKEKSNALQQMFW